MNHPLASFPITSTNNTDEAEFILSHELTDLHINKALDRQLFHLEMNGVHLNQTLLGYNHFNTETLIDPGEVQDAVILIIGTGTPAVFYIDGEPVLCDNQGVILTPSKRVTIYRPADSGIFIIKARLDTIQQRLGTVLDRHSGKPLVFDRSVDLKTSVGAQVRHLANFLTNTFEQDHSVLEHPLLRTGYDDLLINSLLTLPSNYSNQLMDDTRRTVIPGLVRKTEEFMETHASEAITINDLLTQFACSRTALFNAYRRYRDYTPMQFLTNCRLKFTREALLSPASGDTVSSIAYRYGFSHLGRFTVAYRRQFGENPSETLRKTGFEFDR